MYEKAAAMFPASSSGKDPSALRHKSFLLDSKAYIEFRLGLLPAAISSLTQSLGIRRSLRESQSQVATHTRPTPSDILKIEIAISHLQVRARLCW